MLEIKLDPSVLGDLAEELGRKMVTKKDGFEDWRTDFVGLELIVLIGSSKVRFWATAPMKSAVRPPEFRSSVDIIREINEVESMPDLLRRLEKRGT